MKYLALTFLFCSFVTLLNAACYMKPVLDGMTRCRDSVDGTWHDAGDVWINGNCEQCTCTGCCTSYLRPVGFPADCVAEFDKKACKYIVHKKDDPSVLCEVFSAVGK